VLRQEMVDLADGATTRAIRLNRAHPFVQQVLAEWQTRTAARVAAGAAETANDETADDEIDS
jgi:hypothetical protein